MDPLYGTHKYEINQTCFSRLCPYGPLLLSLKLESKVKSEGLNIAEAGRCELQSVRCCAICGSETTYVTKDGYPHVGITLTSLSSFCICLLTNGNKIK
jgi:hypothetical protein